MLRGFLSTFVGGPPRVKIVGDMIEIAGRGTGGPQIKLSDLTEVGVLTTNRGPEQDDTFWMLRTRQRLHSLPWSAEGADKLLALLQTLPGFDNDAVIEASTSTEEAAFLAWSKDDAETG
jgi:hypothetical protein